MWDSEGGKLSKFEIVDKLGFEDVIKKPVAFLSFNELPALLYALLIDKKTPKEIGNVIKSKNFKQQSLIRNFDINADVNDKRIPNKLKKAIKLPVKGIGKFKLIRAIEREELIKPLEYRRVLKYPNKFSNIEKGKIAKWLANDIKRFVRPITRERIKRISSINISRFVRFLWC